MTEDNLYKGEIVHPKAYGSFADPVQAKPQVRIEGRPERDTVINDDDILNLRIALEASASLDDFLSRV